MDHSPVYHAASAKLERLVARGEHYARAWLAILSSTPQLSDIDGADLLWFARDLNCALTGEYHE